MEMKRILQVLAKTDAIPVGTSATAEMSKFKTIINEGSNPHKVSLPVQMVMSHYTNSVVKQRTVSKPSLLRQYVTDVENELIEQQLQKRQTMRQYAKIIAERIQIKDSVINGHTAGFTGGVGPGLQSNEPAESIENKPDIVKLDIPLLIRLLEYAREDAKTDMDLHNITEMMIQLSKRGNVLSMTEYDAIIGEQKLLTKPSSKRRNNDVKK